MQKAASLTGRNAGEITLLAATKIQSAERVREAVEAGVDAVGENRVQELREKQAAGAYSGVKLHFIGGLQTNKAKYLVGVCELIESLDSMELAGEIHRLAKQRGIVQKVLVEVNIGGETSKSGVPPAELKAFLARMADYPALSVVGLMAIPPHSENPEDSRPYFRAMKLLFEEAKGWGTPAEMKILSMGMSEDYFQAILEGSTLIRPGTAIFGPRIITK